MSPSNLIFWSTSRKETPESQQKHALGKKFLRTLLCSNDIFNPGYNRKTLIEREHPFLTEFVLIMNCCFVQHNAPLVKNVSVAQEVTRLARIFLNSVNFKSSSVSLIYVLFR